jgi:acyl-coenzyme A synthetase/AMP-(fatty) acid ligase
VETVDGPLFTERVEAIFNAHPGVRRSALVGIGPQGRQLPVLIIERADGPGETTCVHELQQLAQSQSETRQITHILVHPKLPVDVRHNAKINREALAAWAASRLPELR